MKNSLKRPLPSKGKPNKYSSGGSSSKKRALNVRPPQPASVARLESMLDGATKKKKKLKREAETETAHRKSKNKINGNTEGTKIDPNGSSAVDSSRVSNENTKNDAHIDSSGRDRWSHLNSKSKSKHRTEVVNPFLAINQRKRTTEVIKIHDTKNDASKFSKATTVSSGVSLSGTKKDGEKRKKSMKRKEFRTDDKRIRMDITENPTIGTTFTPKNPTQSPGPIDGSNQRIACDNSEILMTANSRFEIDNQKKQKGIPTQSFSSTQEGTISNGVGNNTTISEDIQLSRQENPVQEATSLTNIKSSSVENKDISISSDSSLRPKLGLRLGNKTTNRKSDSAAISRFGRSRRVTSSPTDFQRTITASDTGHGSREDELLVVLRSPGKFDSALTLASDTVGATRGQSSTEINITVGDEITTRMNVNTNNTNQISKNTRKKTNVNDNFVRLNMKNNAGACRGAKNKSSKYSKERRSWKFRGGATNEEGGRSLDHAPMGNFANPTITFDPPLPPTSFPDNINNQNIEDEGERRKKFSRSKEFNNSKSNATSYVSKMSGLDPLDEFVDGTFHSSETKKAKTSTKNSAATSTSITLHGGASTPDAPKCARHQRPCKLIKVKKATTGNKGREFYACSMPRGEQCDHFQWADDTVEVCLCMTCCCMSTR